MRIVVYCVDKKARGTETVEVRSEEMEGSMCSDEIIE
jgi:hypothetical protein